MRLRVGRSFVPFLLAAVLATGSACNNNSTSTTSTTTTTTAPSTAFSVTETFTGTLTTNGAASYSFTAQSSGTVFVTLTTLTDSVDSTITVPAVGISLGTWNGTSCAVQTGIFTDTAGPGASIAGTVTGAGVLCARIYDPASRITDPLNYTITVTHP
jgi:hypothetical protein